MSAESRTTLKTYFETSDAPTEAQFASLIDSFYSLISDFRVLFGTLSQSGTSAPGLTILFNSLGFTPTTSYGSVGDYFIESVGNFDSAKTVAFIGATNVFGDFVSINVGDGIDALGVFSGTDASTPANGILTDVSVLILQIP